MLLPAQFQGPLMAITLCQASRPLLRPTRLPGQRLSWNPQDVTSLSAARGQSPFSPFEPQQGAVAPPMGPAPPPPRLRPSRRPSPPLSQDSLGAFPMRMRLVFRDSG